MNDTKPRHPLIFIVVAAAVIFPLTCLLQLSHLTGCNVYLSSMGGGIYGRRNINTLFYSIYILLIAVILAHFTAVNFGIHFAIRSCIVIGWKNDFLSSLKQHHCNLLEYKLWVPLLPLVWVTIITLEKHLLSEWLWVFLLNWNKGIWHMMYHFARQLTHNRISDQIIVLCWKCLTLKKNHVVVMKMSVRGFWSRDFPVLLIMLRSL